MLKCHTSDASLIEEGQGKFVPTQRLEEEREMDEESRRILYKCVVCLDCSDTPGIHHGRPRVRCDAGSPGSEKSRPLLAQDGRPLAHAPKWWVMATWDLERQSTKYRRE